MIREGITTPRDEVFTDANFEVIKERFGYDRASSFRRNTVIPDFSARSVLDVSFEELSDDGLDYCLLDLDLTVRRANATEIDEDIVEHLATARSKGLIKGLWIATDSEVNITNFEEQLEADGSFQPFRNGYGKHTKGSLYFWKQLKAQLEPINSRNTIMIGDRYAKDVRLAGRPEVGLKTCKVEPLGKDYWFDRLPGRNIRKLDESELFNYRYNWGVVLDAVGIDRPITLRHPSFLPPSHN